MSRAQLLKNVHFPSPAQSRSAAACTSVAGTSRQIDRDGRDVAANDSHAEDSDAAFNCNWDDTLFNSSLKQQHPSKMRPSQSSWDNDFDTDDSKSSTDENNTLLLTESYSYQVVTESDHLSGCSAANTAHYGTNSNSNDYVFGLFNARNAKLIAFVAFLTVMVYHSVLHLMSIRQDACIGLLETGRYQGEHMWQPYGCMIHTYSQADSRVCVEAHNRRESKQATSWMLFVGDSRARQLYEVVLAHFAPSELSGAEINSTTQTFSDHSYHELTLKLKLEYKYSRTLDDSVVNMMGAFADLARQEQNDSLPSVIVLATALDVANLTDRDVLYSSMSTTSTTSTHAPSTQADKENEYGAVRQSERSWTADGEMSEAAVEYQTNVSQLLPHVQMLRHTVTVVYMLQPGVDEQRLDAVNPNRTWLFTNKHIQMLNAHADKILSYSAVRLWRSAASLSDGYMSDSPNGLALGKVALTYDLQILLNLYCNDAIRFGDATCCGRKEELSHVQLATFAIYALCIVIAVLMLLARVDIQSALVVASHAENGRSSGYSRVRTSDSSTNHNAPTQSVNHHLAAQSTPLAHTTASLNARECAERSKGRRRPSHLSSKRRIFPLMLILSRLAAIMLFFYLCDRADFFMKENKWFTYFNLFLPIVYLSVLGLFFTEHTANAEFLSREQSHEMKGAMQLVILSSHLTGAIDIAWVYMMNRCLLSAYYFQLGYGHFMYFWTTGDYSVTRLFRVLFRYNLLVVLLCLTMNRPYQFYSFVPLVSFWFLVIYATMACPPRVCAAHVSAENSTVPYFLMICKFIVLFSMISVLYISQVFFERLVLFGPWKWLFTTSSSLGPVHDWWTKWWHDRYSAPFGMVFALIVCLLRRHACLNETQPGATLFVSRHVSWLVALGSVMAVSIIGYLLLRNVFGCVRARVSHFFSWFGRITLELFTAQHHIWLVSDSHGVLVLLPRYPVLNVMLTSYVFICVAHELRQLSVLLVPVLLPPDTHSQHSTIEKLTRFMVGSSSGDPFR